MSKKADAGHSVGATSPFHRALIERYAQFSDNLCVHVLHGGGLTYSLNEDQSVLQNAATSEVIARANRLLIVGLV